MKKGGYDNAGNDVAYDGWHLYLFQKNIKQSRYRYRCYDHK
jgi:hypothetical protein